MKIGILTFYFAHNYGAMLQAYALKSYLSQQGNDVSIIPYESRLFYRQYKSSPFSIKKNPFDMIKHFKRYKYKKPQVRRFEVFEAEYLGADGRRLTSQQEVESFIKGFDLIIVGSDQVWNKNLTGNDLIYFGNRLTQSFPYVSFSACMGDYDMADAETVELVKAFRAVSVREEDSAQLLKSKGVDAQICVDPVFLRDAQCWQTLAERSAVRVQEPYILYYSLQEPQELIDKTQRLAGRTDLAVKMIDGKLRKRKMTGEMLCGVGPLEFLSLIKGAQFVCTDSFHALAFSIIFGKKVLLQAHAKTGNRTKQLLSLVGIGDMQDIIDCANVNKTKLEDMIGVSKDYLRSAEIRNNED